MSKSDPIPAEAKADPKAAKREHFANIETHLARFEAELAEEVANPHCPPDRIIDLGNAIAILRAERARHQ